MNREHPPDIVTCRECEAEFDLSKQKYYGNICPTCLTKEDPERTWPACWRCNERIPPDERAKEYIRGGRRDPATVRVPVHEDCKSPPVYR